MTPLDPIWWLALAASLTTGMVVHELSHAAVAWPLAEAVSIDWRAWETVVDYGPRPGYAPLLVALAPLLGALAAAGVSGVIRATGSWFDEVWLSVLWILFLSVWGMAGGPAEYQNLPIGVDQPS